MSTLPFTELVDLAQERLGGVALAANDEFFAEKENLLKPGRGVFIADKYTDRGKWMDGWETRRRRTPGYDWCIIRLGLAGVIRGIDVDTNFFTGNNPEAASLEACEAPADATVETLSSANWIELAARTTLKGGSQNLIPVSNPRRFTHVRLNIFPDGGVARLRVHGEVIADWPRLRSSAQAIDLAAIENGGQALISSDNYFSHKDNLIMPGASRNMGDGWETKRRRGPGHDWVVLKLGAPGTLERIEVFTTHFKGNYPDRCSLEGALLKEAFRSDVAVSWSEILPETKLSADMKHVFERVAGPYSHVRLNIFPDGGIARLRLFGKPA